MNQPAPETITYLASDGLTMHQLSGEYWTADRIDLRELASLRVALIQALTKIEDALAADSHSHLRRLTSTTPTQQVDLGQ